MSQLSRSKSSWHWATETTSFWLSLLAVLLWRWMSNFCLSRKPLPHSLLLMIFLPCFGSYFQRLTHTASITFPDAMDE